MVAFLCKRSSNWSNSSWNNDTICFILVDSNIFCQNWGSFGLVLLQENYCGWFYRSKHLFYVMRYFLSPINHKTINPLSILFLMIIVWLTCPSTSSVDLVCIENCITRSTTNNTEKHEETTEPDDRKQKTRISGWGDRHPGTFLYVSRVPLWPSITLQPKVKTCRPFQGASGQLCSKTPHKGDTFWPLVG